MKDTVTIQEREYKMVPTECGKGFTLEETLWSEWQNFWSEQKQSEVSKTIEKAICDYIKKEIPDLQSLPFNERQARVNEVLYGKEPKLVWDYWGKETMPQKIEACTGNPEEAKKLFGDIEEIKKHSYREENAKMGAKMQEACERIREEAEKPVTIEFIDNPEIPKNNGHGYTGLEWNSGRKEITFKEGPLKPGECMFNIDALKKQKSTVLLKEDLETLKEDTKQRIRNLAEKHGMTEVEARILYTMVP
jgi:hypothetical protein